jgi:hypothetical protein
VSETHQTSLRAGACARVSGLQLPSWSTHAVKGCFQRLAHHPWRMLPGPRTRAARSAAGPEDAITDAGVLRARQCAPESTLEGVEKRWRKSSGLRVRDVDLRREVVAFAVVKRSGQAVRETVFRGRAPKLMEVTNEGSRRPGS